MTGILNIWELNMKQNTHDFRKICAKNPAVHREFEKCETLQDRLRCIRRLSSVCTFVKSFIDSPVMNKPSINSNIAGSLWRTVAIGRATTMTAGSSNNKKRGMNIVKLMQQAICEGLPTTTTTTTLPPEEEQTKAAQYHHNIHIPPGLDVFSWDIPETRQWRDGCVKDMTDIFHKTMELGMKMDPLIVDRGSATKCSNRLFLDKEEEEDVMVECGPKFLYREREAKGWLVEHLEKLGYSSLSGMIRAYANLIAQEHGITAEWIFDSNNIVLIYYDKHIGIPSHIDNITYTTGGPIYAAGIGPASSLFDMIPATVDGIPVRLEVTELSAVRLQGESRFQWSHAIPFGFNGIKFTILFRLDMLANTQMKLDPFLQAHLPSSSNTGVVVDEELVVAMNKKKSTNKIETQHYGILKNNNNEDVKSKSRTTMIITKAEATRARFLNFWRSTSNNMTLELMCSDEETRHITNPKDSVQMCQVMAVIIAKMNVSSYNSQQKKKKMIMHFIDAFACVGSDALTAATFLGSSGLITDVLCVQSTDDDEITSGRYARLHHNAFAVKTSVPIIPFPMDIKRFLSVYASTFGEGDSILYMDPPWDSEPDIVSFIDANVLKQWPKKKKGLSSSSSWRRPTLVCVKVPSLLIGMEKLLGDRLDGKYECAGNLHIRQKYFFSFFVDN